MEVGLLPVPKLLVETQLTECPTQEAVKEASNMWSLQCSFVALSDGSRLQQFTCGPLCVAQGRD